MLDPKKLFSATEKQHEIENFAHFGERCVFWEN
jgi:hypothetical protein